MQYVYEFEIYKGNKGFIVEPFDFEGATQGVDVKDACESAFDWLNMTLEDYVIKGAKPQKQHLKTGLNTVATFSSLAQMLVKKQSIVCQPQKRRAC